MNVDLEVRERLAGLAAALLATVAIGVLGYRWIEGWNFFDSLYMTVTTLATVGFGELHPLSGPGRVFTMALILFGIGILTYALSTFTAFVVEGDLKDVLRRRRMQAKIAKLSGHYILCGAGHTGQTIIEELHKTGRDFVVVEKDPARVELLQSKGVLALQGDATHDEVLRQAGIERAFGVFGAMPTDPDNVFVTISAKGLNPNLRIVSKQQEAGVVEKLKRSGADVVVNPAHIGGLRMASEMVRPAAVGFMDSMIRAEGKVFRIEEVTVTENSPLKDKPLQEIKGAQGNAALVLAVKHPYDKTYEINPDPTRKLEVGEILVAMGTVEQIKELAAKVAG